jgi:hypothetical protein
MPLPNAHVQPVVDHTFFSLKASKPMIPFPHILIHISNSTTYSGQIHLLSSLLADGTFNHLQPTLQPTSEKESKCPPLKPLLTTSNSTTHHHHPLILYHHPEQTQIRNPNLQYYVEVLLLLLPLPFPTKRILPSPYKKFIGYI